jgi:hypothetical protein
MTQHAQATEPLLCDDVLRLVFRACADAYTWHGERHYSFVHIAEVCKQWHRVLMADPALFSRIDGDESAMAQLLALSGHIPLTVSLPYTNSKDKFLEWAALLGPHMARVRHFQTTVNARAFDEEDVVRVLDQLFGVAQLVELESMDFYMKNMTVFLDTSIIFASFLTQPPPRLRELKLRILHVEWASPLFAGSLRSVYVEDDNIWHYTPASSVYAVHAALQAMPLLESLTIVTRRGFLPAAGAEAAFRLPLTFPRLWQLALHLPPRDATLLTARIVAPALRALRVQVELRFDRAHELHLDVFAAALEPHVACVSVARPLIHFDICGAAPAHGLFDMWIRLRPACGLRSNRLHLSPPDSLPLAVSFKVGSDLKGDLHAGVPTGRQDVAVDVRALAGMWERAPLVAFAANETLLPAPVWRELLGGQPHIAAAEIWSGSCIALFEALRDDAGFLPALARLRVRGRPAYLDDERLLPALCSTFGPRAPRAALEELVLQSYQKFGTVEPEHLERVRECAGRVTFFSGWY